MLREREFFYSGGTRRRFLHLGLGHGAAALLVVCLGTRAGEAFPPEPAEAAAVEVPGLLFTVKHGEHNITCVAVSADGSTLLTGGQDKTARFWNATDGAPRGTTLTLERDVMQVGLSPDGRYATTKRAGNEPNLAIQRNGSSLRFNGYSREPLYSLWDLSADKGGQPMMESRGPLAIAADGKAALAFDWDNSSGTAFFRTCQLANGDRHEMPVRPEREAQTNPWLLSPDLHTMLSFVFVRPLELSFSDTKTGKILGTHQLGGNDWASHFCFRPDCRVLAASVNTVSDNKHRNGKGKRTVSNPRLQLVDVPSGRTLKEMKLLGTLHGVAFNPRGDLLACCVRKAESSELELRDAKTGAIRGPSLPIKKVSSVAFSGDGKRLFVGKYDSTAELWELDALLKPVAR